MTGSCLWNLFCKQSNMVEKSWNVSIRCMFKLPMNTHKYLIESITKSPHLKFVLLKRFLGFLDKIRKGKKTKLRHILKFVENDCQSVTGLNLRNILLLTDKHKIEDLCQSDIFHLTYRPIPENERWRPSLLEELLEIRDEQQDLFQFDKQHVDDMINFVCTT